MLNNSHVIDQTKFKESIDDFADVPSEDTKIDYNEDRPGLKSSKQSTSTESLRFPSGSELVECVEDGTDGRLASSRYAEAHKRGYKERKQSEAKNKKELEKEFKEYINKLENTYFQIGHKGHTIFSKIADGIESNARGGRGKNYVYVTPTWKDFAHWERWSDVIDGVNDFTDTHPEKCLDRFLCYMRDRGWFGPSDGPPIGGTSSMGSYNISWSLVEDERKASSQKKVKFEWHDLASVSPVVSIDRKLNDVKTRNISHSNLMGDI